MKGGQMEEQNNEHNKHNNNNEHGKSSGDTLTIKSSGAAADTGCVAVHIYLR